MLSLACFDALVTEVIVPIEPTESEVPVGNKSSTTGVALGLTVSKKVSTVNTDVSPDKGPKYPHSEHPLGDAPYSKS